MGAYWLAPMRMTPSAAISAQRVRLSPEEGERLRQAFDRAHPRLLPLCKLRLFAGDGPDADAASCRIDGTGGADPVWLLTPGDIELGGGGAVSLTHCGQAFVDRLLAPEEALAFAERGRVSESGPPWTEAIVRWWRQGFGVMLLKEE